MNTAIQDSFDLGWKLAWVLRGCAYPSLLDSSQTERRPRRASQRPVRRGTTRRPRHCRRGPPLGPQRSAGPPLDPHTPAARSPPSTSSATGSSCSRCPANPAGRALRFTIAGTSQSRSMCLMPALQPRSDYNQTQRCWSGQTGEKPADGLTTIDGFARAAPARSRPCTRCRPRATRPPSDASRQCLGRRMAGRRHQSRAGPPGPRRAGHRHFDMTFDPATASSPPHPPDHEYRTALKEGRGCGCHGARRVCRTGRMPSWPMFEQSGGVDPGDVDGDRSPDTISIIPPTPLRVNHRERRRPQGPGRSRFSRGP
jgi:hypothetical protein